LVQKIGLVRLAPLEMPPDCRNTNSNDGSQYPERILSAPRLFLSWFHATGMVAQLAQILENRNVGTHTHCKGGILAFVMLLYHGTSEKIAKVIIDTECLKPGGTRPITANSAYVYLTECPEAALAFGHGRVMGYMDQGSWKMKIIDVKLKEAHDRVAVFEIESEALDESLMRESDRQSGLTEIAYEGIVPNRAIKKVTYVHMNKKVEDIARLLFLSPEELIGTDLAEGLTIETFDLEWD
jgi:hypothetical protein